MLGARVQHQCCGGLRPEPGLLEQSQACLEQSPACLDPGLVLTSYHRSDVRRKQWRIGNRQDADRIQRGSEALEGISLTTHCIGETEAFMSLLHMKTTAHTHLPDTHSHPGPRPHPPAVSPPSFQRTFSADPGGSERWAASAKPDRKSVV